MSFTTPTIDVYVPGTTLGIGNVNAGTINIGKGGTEINVDGSMNVSNINTNTMNPISSDLSIGASQTSGALNIGCSGNEAVTGRTTGVINIGTDLSATGIIKLGNQTTSTPVQIRGTLTVARASTFTTTVGVSALLTANGGITASGGINLNTQASSSAAINILTGVTQTGSVNIATGTGINQSSSVNIGTGTTSGAVKIGNSANQIELNALTLLKATKKNIVTFASQAYTLTEATSKTSSFYGSTYTSATPSASNDVIAVTLPTPTTAMLGMTLTFRKLRGCVSNSGQNWTFACPTSSIVPISLTFTSTPTVVIMSVPSFVARFTVIEVSSVLYYFALQ